MQTIHPLLVHFPVALVSLYAILEIASIIPFIRKMNLGLTKTILLGIGFLFGALSSITGEEIEHSFRGMKALVETHATWATTTNILAAILFVLYLIYILKAWINTQKIPESFKPTLVKIQNIISTIHTKQWILPILAILVLLSITITGALGAVIVHGPNVDPVVKFIYTLLVK